jgi:hypothetical protein
MSRALLMSGPELVSTAANEETPVRTQILGLFGAKCGARGAAAAEQVAAGQAHTLFLVNPASLDLDKLDSWECETAAEEAAAPSADAAKGGAACTPPRLAVLDMLRWLIVVRAELTLNPPPRPSELLAAQASLQV